MERYFPDGFTRDGAYRLCRTIKQFWNARGKYPQVWIEQEGDIYVVRSNITLTGGQP